MRVSVSGRRWEWEERDSTKLPLPVLNSHLNSRSSLKLILNLLQLIPLTQTRPTITAPPILFRPSCLALYSL